MVMHGFTQLLDLGKTWVVHGAYHGQTMHYHGLAHTMVMHGFIQLLDLGITWEMRGKPCIS